MTSEPLGQLPLLTGPELDLLHGLLDRELRPLEQIDSTLPIDLAVRRTMLNSLRTAVAETRAGLRLTVSTSVQDDEADRDFRGQNHPNWYRDV